MSGRDRRFRRAMLAWHRAHGRDFPWRNTHDTFAVLIGELLLQRTRGEHAVDVYERFMDKWPNAEALARATEREILDVIRPLGLPQRAHTIAEMADQVGRQEQIPTKPDVLLQLSGVGPYVAHAVPIFARSRNMPLVDWVIARVLRRYYGLSGNARPNADKELWALAERLARPGRARSLWLGTLDFAAAICRNTPACDSCPLGSACPSARFRPLTQL